jgi:S1-C subfamily serine protease
MSKILMTGALVWALASGFAVAQDAPDVDSGSPAGKDSVKLTTGLMALPAGTPWLSVRFDRFCLLAPANRIWGGGRVAQDIAPYATSFKTELERAGYKVVTPGETNLFEEALGAADYEAAAVITEEHIDACRKRDSVLRDLLTGEDHSLIDVKGDGSMTIDWQIYARLKKQVVAHVSTKGQSRLDSAVSGGTARLIAEAFADNVRQLASNADFRAALSAPRPFTAGFQMPGQQDKIFLAGSLKAGPRKIADAVGSVVTIMNDIGSGSAVLISSDGYLLTDAHVVGDDKEAQVRWSDGFVTLGQVVRVAKNRDVAIIKTNPRDRTPLAIKRGRVTPGQRVYAIGSPRGKDFQGTVSSGIISADRVVDGLRYIQSDTTVSHGSSGGPLLDESGAVIGLTDLGVDNDGPAGLNLFTPIGDVMDFLSLEQK